MTDRWYVTFHGGAGAHAWNNIHVFDADGRPLGKALHHHKLPEGIELRELRGFAFGPDGDLYVADAYYAYSQVLRFRGRPDAEGKHDFIEVFVHSKHHPVLDHPFNLSFSPNGNLYVTNQNTGIVSRFYGPLSKDGTPGTAMPHPQALKDRAKGHLHPGTFVASSHEAATGVEQVRHATFGPGGHLYVVDRDANKVKSYHVESGELVGEISSEALDKPIHMLAVPGKDHLFVGSRNRNAVLICDTVSGKVETFIKEKAGGLHEPGGLALGNDGYLYVASRGGMQVLRFHAETGHPDSKPFIEGLKDQPEFLMRLP